MSHIVASPFVSTESIQTNGGASKRLGATLRGGGLWYTALYLTRWAFQRFAKSVERRLVAIEQKKGIVEPWSVSAQRHSAAENKFLWNTHDWSTRGEEWTQSAEWKQQILEQFMFPNIPNNVTLLEIGPGGGRWTEELQKRATKLFVLDVSEKAIQLCRDRFSQCANIEFVVGNGSSIPLGDGVIDAVWSYDVFVHINPVDTRAYFRDLARILKRGGRAVIHHPGPPNPKLARRPGWRSDLTDKMVADFVAESGLHIVSQSSQLVNPGDILSFIEKPR